MTMEMTEMTETYTVTAAVGRHTSHRDIDTARGRVSRHLRGLGRKVVMTLMVAVMIAIGTVEAKALTELGASDRNRILTQVMSGYTQWNTVELNGRVSADMLPVSVSARIYMERGRLVIISLRVPLLGEQARIEVDSNNLTIINRMSGKYCTVPMSEVNSKFPGGIEDLQGVLLSRLVLLGVGELSRSNADKAQVYRTSGGEYIVMPVPSIDVNEAGYGYLLDKSMRIASMAVASADGRDSVAVDYNYAGGGTEMDIQVSFAKKYHSGNMTLDAPKWNARAMERAEIGDRYKKVTLKEVFK